MATNDDVLKQVAGIEAKRVAGHIDRQLAKMDEKIGRLQAARVDLAKRKAEICQDKARRAVRRMGGKDVKITIPPALLVAETH